MSSIFSLVPVDYNDDKVCLVNSNNEKQKQRRHQSLPPSPIVTSKPQSVSNREHRHSWSRKPQLREIPEESQHATKDGTESIQQTTQYILDEIKNLAEDILEAEARADTFKLQYSETLDELDAVKRAYQGILQQLKEQQEQDRIKTQYYQDLLRRQSQQWSPSSCYPSSSSCYPSSSSTTTIIPSSSSSTKKSSKIKSVSKLLIPS